MAEQTVYLAYRHPLHERLARCIYDLFQDMGYEVFMQDNPPRSGHITPLVQHLIRASTHFMAILSPATIEGFPNLDPDPLHDEFEFALETRRDVVSLNLYGFRATNYPRYFQGRLATWEGLRAIQQDALDIEILQEALHKQFADRSVLTQVQALPDEDRQAVQHMQAVIEARPVPDMLMLLQERQYGEAQLLYAQGERTAALQIYDNLLAKDPHYIEAYKMRSLMYHLLGDLSQAIENYNAILAQEPHNLRFWHNRALAYLTLNDFDRAFEDFEAILQHDPDHDSAHNGRSIVYMVRGNLDQALADAHKAVAHMPKLPYAYDTRAVVYFERGDIALALADFRKAYSIDPKQLGSLAGLAACNMVLNRTDEALRLWRRVIEQEPRFADTAWVNQTYHWQTRILYTIQSLADAASVA